jgi:hypothetical protein
LDHLARDFLQNFFGQKIGVVLELVERNKLNDVSRLVFVGLTVE